MTDALLTEIRDELRTHTALLRELCQALGAPRARRLSAADEAALLELLPVIVEAVHGHPFTLPMLAEHAKLNVAPALAVRSALATTNPRKLGRLLHKAVSFEVGNYHVKKLRPTRGGVLWHVQCDEPSSRKLATLAPARRVRFK